MKSGLKKIIRKIPLAAGAAKLFYDWRQEKKLRSKIKRFLSADALPFTKEAPPRYSVGYEPTIRCNLRCKMCYQAQTRLERQEELSPADILGVFEKLKNKIKSIKLVGGEPFVREDIFGMISFWERAGRRVILQTNCTLIDEKTIEVLKDYKCVTDILTSLDGPPATHDAIRGVPGTFERLKKAIGLLRKHMRNVNITAFATMLFFDNLDKLFELIDTAKALGLGGIVVLFEQVYSSYEVKEAKEIFEKVFGWSEGDYRLNTQIRDPIFSGNLDRDEIRRKLRAARRYGLKKGCYVNFSPFDYYLHLDKYIDGKPACPPSPSAQSDGRRGRPFCLKLLSPELRINQKGEVIWCDIIEKSFGSLLKKTPDEIWLSPEYQKFRDYLFKNSLPVCRRCCKAVYPHTSPSS